MGKSAPNTRHGETKVMKEINRRHLLLGSASLALSGACASTSPLPREVQNISSLPDLQQVMSYGIMAPNPHNTQAWRMKEMNSNTFALFVDPKRLLPATDPNSRQILIGHGAFLENCSIAAEALGYKLVTHLFPNGTVNVLNSKNPVAICKLRKLKEPKVSPLFAEIPKRKTNRSEHINKRVTKEVEQKLSQLAYKVGVPHPKFVTEKSVERLKPVVLEAFSNEMQTTRLAEETLKWWRFNDGEIKSRKDGISIRTSGTKSRSFVWMAENLFIDKENFLNESNTQKGIELFTDSINNSSNFGYIMSHGNTYHDQVKSGMSYVRFQLAASVLGLGVHPLSQVLQELPEMEAPQHEVNKLFLATENDKVQMLFRFGEADAPLWTSPRRELKSFLG